MRAEPRTGGGAAASVGGLWGVVGGALARGLGCGGSRGYRGPTLLSSSRAPAQAYPLPLPGLEGLRAGASDPWPRAARAERCALSPVPADIYDKVSGELQKKGYDCECLGGGRISHQSQDKKIHVYGYSMVRPQPRPALQAARLLSLLSQLQKSLPARSLPVSHVPRVGGRPLPVPQPQRAESRPCPKSLIGLSLPPSPLSRQDWGKTQAPPSSFTKLSVETRGFLSAPGIVRALG